MGLVVAPPRILTRKDFASCLRETRARVIERGGPSFVTEQLELLTRATEAGRTPTDAERAQLSLGVYAVRNIEDADWELARDLCELDGAFRRYEELGSDPPTE